MLRARTSAALLLAFATVLAAAPEARAEAPEPLRYDLRVDAAVTAAAGALWIATELFKEDLAADRCRFCGVNRLDGAVRERLVWSETDRPRVASDVVAFGLVPAAVLAHGLLAARGAGDVRDGWIDLLVVVQAAAIAADLNQLTKLAVARQRPFVHYRNFDDPNRAPDSDDNRSFYSGHSSLAFSLAAAAGTVSTMRGYRSAGWVWGVGMSLAASAAYLRIAADQHYLTDVLTGAVLGTAVGAGVPWLLHRARGRGDARGGAEGGLAVIPIVGGVVVFF
jgi:membrane-associated phospholipid phosphatase